MSPSRRGMARRGSRRRALDLVAASGSRLRRDGRRYLPLTSAQEAFYLGLDVRGRPAKEALWRDGNQLGKSFALARLIVDVCMGVHPTIKRRRAKVLVVSVSFEQMAPLMEKIWQLAPKAKLKFGEFDEGRGFCGKPPRVIFDNGATITFATYGQGSTRVAGGTYDLVCMDEPPTEGMYGEVRPRVLKRRGFIRVTMTPTPEMPPQDWYRERVERGMVTEYNFGLSEAILQPPGYPMPWLSQAEIDEYAAGLLEVERGMRVKGDWAAKILGAWMRSFTRERNVQPQDLASLARWELAVGADHGTSGKKQAAVLVAARFGATPRPRVRVLAETTSKATTTRPEEDAAAIQEMLRSVGLEIGHVDKWVGDVSTGSWKTGVVKSNAALRDELRRLDPNMRGDIERPVKGRGSVAEGVRLLNTLADRDHLEVDPRARRFIMACEQFDGDEKHKLKDVLDAGRYATEALCTGRVVPVLEARY